jgi:hypothetical protein
MIGNHLPAAVVLGAMRALLVIATMAAIGAAAAGCGSGSGGNDTRIAIHAVVRAGCAAGGVTGRAYPGSIVIAGTQSRTVVKIGGRDVARVDVDPGGYQAGAAWVAGSRLISAHVDGRVARVRPNGLVHFTAPSGADMNLSLVVALRRTECNSPGAAG